MLHQASWEDVMPFIEWDSVQLVVTSPPYNMGKNFSRKGVKTSYGVHDDNMEEMAYRRWIGEMAAAVTYVLKEGGHFYLNLKSRYRDWECIFPWWAVEEVERSTYFQLRDVIIWDYQSTPDIRRDYWRREYEMFFWFTGPEHPPLFDEHIRIPRQTVRNSGSKAGGGPADGVIPSNVWTIRRLNNIHWRESGHPALFPPEAIERIVLASTKPGDTVLDPFAGIGTTGAVCHWNDRNFIGCEIDPAYVDYANQVTLVEDRPKWAEWDWLTQPKQKELENW